jgi:predicted ATPase
LFVVDNRRPFSAIITAVAQLVDSVLSYDAALLQSIQHRLDDGLGDNAGVAIQLVPSIALITGPRPAPQPLGQSESQNRLHRTFLQLLRIFASTSPLVATVHIISLSAYYIAATEC